MQIGGDDVVAAPQYHRAGKRRRKRALQRRVERRGVDPLDTSKYILAARSALEGGIFDL